MRQVQGCSGGSATVIADWCKVACSLMQMFPTYFKFAAETRNVIRVCNAISRRRNNKSSYVFHFKVIFYCYQNSFRNLELIFLYNV